MPALQKINYGIELHDNDSMFRHQNRDEAHPWTLLEPEQKKQYLEAYANEHAQPYHKVVDFVNKHFKSESGGKSVFSSEGFHQVRKSDSSYLNYINSIGQQLFKSAEDWQNAWKNAFNNSIRLSSNDNHSLFPDQTRLMYGQEAYAGTMTYQNRDNFQGLVSFAIAGWFGQSKILELYKPIENGQEPTIPFTYTLDYAVLPNKTKIPLPQGYRTTDLEGVYDLPSVNPIFISTSETPEIMDSSIKYNTIDFDKSTEVELKHKEVDLGDGWVKNGKNCNLIVSSCDGNNNNYSDKNSLEPTVAIADILYIGSYKSPESSPEPIYFSFPFEIPSQPAMGQQNIFKFGAKITLPEIKIVKSNALETVYNHEERIYGEINIDTGDFCFASASANNAIESVIVAVKINAKISDNANERPGIEHEVAKFKTVLQIEYTNFGHIPLSPYVLDNWNFGNDSIGFVASMTDKMTNTYTITRDLKAEKALMADFRKSPVNFFLTEKLGSFYKRFTHDYAVTGPVAGEDPYKQSAFALKERIIRGLSESATHLFIPDNIQREWVLFGPDRIVQCFASITNYNQVPNENGDPQATNSAVQKFGFNIGSAGSFIDSLGRGVKIMGCTDIRWQDRNIIGGLKSYDMSYPTFLYYAYMFRIFTGIDPEHRNLSAVLFFGRDNIFSLLKVHTEIIISNYDDTLYEKVAKQSRTRFMVSDSKEE